MEQLRSTGVYFMGIDQKKISYSWGFIPVTQQVFYTAKFCEKSRFYNLKYKFSADYDFFYRMIVKCKLSGIGTKKDEVFGVFRKVAFQVKLVLKTIF